MNEIIERERRQARVLAQEDTDGRLVPAIGQVRARFYTSGGMDFFDMGFGFGTFADHVHDGRGRWVDAEVPPDLVAHAQVAGFDVLTIEAEVASQVAKAALLVEGI